MARDTIRMLLNYSASRDIGIPFAGIRIETSPVLFGGITFHPITLGDREGDWWEKIDIHILGILIMILSHMGE